MPEMRGTTQHIFSELYKTTLNTFTHEELERIDAAAEELKAILDTAKKRDRDRADQPYK
jgi:hypothetical protein